MRNILRNSLQLLFLPVLVMVVSVVVASPPPLMAQEFIVDIEDLPAVTDGAGVADVADDFAADEISGKIEVAPAPPLSADDFGVLDSERGEGLPADMWQGSQRTDIEELLTLVDSGFTAPSIRNLLRKLLLTRAQIPDSKDAFARNIFELRVAALTSMGAVDEALLMLNQLPRSLHSAGSRWQLVELLLLRRDYDSACTEVKKAVTLYEQEHWQRALILCHAQAGEYDAAALGIELLREQNMLPTNFFLQAIEIISEKLGNLQDASISGSLFDAAILLAVVPEEKLQELLPDLPLAVWAVLAEEGGAYKEKYGDDLRRQARKLLLPYMDDSAKIKGREDVITADEIEKKIRSLWENTAYDNDSHLLQRLYILGRALRINLDKTHHKGILLKRVDYHADFPSPLLRERLRRAAGAKRLGETLLLAALVAGGKDFAQVADYVLSDVIVALRMVGQHGIAREVAVDALAALEQRESSGKNQER